MIGNPSTFWGKVNIDSSSNAFEWHPLEHHCIDVAACVEALIKLPLTLKRLGKLAEYDINSDVIIQRLSFLGALHDVGKYNIGFQNKAFNRQPTEGHVQSFINLLCSNPSLHFKSLKEALDIETISSWGENDTPIRLLIASISHHGKPVKDNVQFNKNFWESQNNLHPFQGIASLKENLKMMFPSAFIKEGGKLPNAIKFQHAFCGLVSLADWIASSTTFFPFSSALEDDRISFARKRAREAIQKMGIDGQYHRSLICGEELTFERLFKFGPRPAQKKVLELPMPSDESGSITILEAETGSGKTEGAFIHFAKLFSKGLVDGMCFALPTRSAATQIYIRIYDFVKTMYLNEQERPQTILALPGYLSVDGISGKPLPNFEVLWDDDDNERFKYRGWAAENPKRFLSAPILVGTIDQILMSAIEIKHSHLRAFSLFRHLLVVDEVHASDSYMSALLLNVIKRHFNAGGHAFLMSATLGSSLKNRLINLSSVEPLKRFEEELSSSYPLITQRLGEKDIKSYSIDQTKERRREITLETIDTEDMHAIASRALEAVKCGAKTLIIRNTVSLCLETQEAVEKLAKELSLTNRLFNVNGVVCPFHARFSKEDRETMDNAIERIYGKNTPQEPCLAIATQTVEQSLDIDADFLITDICPMDVLLQRIGRLHRHEKDRRPDDYKQPKALVILPSKNIEDLITKNGEAIGKNGLGYVYDNLLIVEATIRILKDNKIIKIPSMNRELVERATHPEALDKIAKSSLNWLNHKSKTEGIRFAQQGIAVLNLVQWEKEFGDYTFSSQSEDFKKRVSSRLGEADRLASFVEPLKTPFDNYTKSIRIPYWMARGVDAEAEPKEVLCDKEKISFKYGEKAFTYSRNGLRLENHKTNEVKEDETD